MQDIKDYDTFSKIQQISKGMSSDKKYRIETADGRRLLLRVADISEYERKKTEFDIMKKAVALGVPMSQPVDFGKCDSGISVYTLLTWIDGDEVETVLPTLTESEQYALGVKSGEILLKIHTIPVPANADDWAVRYFAVIDERLDAFRREGIPFNGDATIIAFLESNRHLLKGRPQYRHHSDYHEGNMILSESGEISIIDWHTVDFDNFGDPWYEFNRIGTTFPAFASGQIDGYFHGEPPQEFWTLLAYYLAASAITSIVWAKYYAPERLGAILQLNLDLLSWFDNMQNLVPIWYLNKMNIEKQIYFKNPCGTLSTAFWKRNHFKVPDGIVITHEDSVNCKGCKSTRYFKLIHYPLMEYDTSLSDDYIYRSVIIPDDAELVADFINRCYEGYDIKADEVLRWTKYPVFDNALWVFISIKNSSIPVALGIADFDSDIKEGSLEWIQVLPEMRDKGFGQKIVCELLSRLKSKAAFVTVSGECDNPSNPEKLYRKCGFNGNDIWCVQRTGG